MSELRDAQRALNDCGLVNKSLIVPGQELYTLTSTDIAALKRAEEAWRAFLAVARQRWKLGDDEP